MIDTQWAVPLLVTRRRHRHVLNANHALRYQLLAAQRHQAELESTIVQLRAALAMPRVRRQEDEELWKFLAAAVLQAGNQVHITAASLHRASMPGAQLVFTEERTAAAVGFTLEFREPAPRRREVLHGKPEAS